MRLRCGRGGTSPAGTDDPIALHTALPQVAPLSCGEIEPSHLLGELGAVLSGVLAGRTSDVETTLFKSVGIALEDLTAAVAMQRASSSAEA